MLACMCISQLVCYILSAKKQQTLVQIDVSCVKGVISKETLFNKTDQLLLFLHHGIPRLPCRGFQSHASRTRLRNSSHHGEIMAVLFLRTLIHKQTRRGLFYSSVTRFIKEIFAVKRESVFTGEHDLQIPEKIP